MSRTAEAVFRRALIDSVPVLMGYLTMGFVAGVLLAAKANLVFSPLWGFLTSLTSMSGTFNYALVQPVANRVPLWSIALLVVGINFRYLFYGWTMLAHWRHVSFLKKVFLIATLSDENYALEAACRYKNSSAHLRYCFTLSALNLSYWVLGVTAGALAVVILNGALDPAVIRRYTNGMEFAMAALFLVILTDQLKRIFSHANK